MGTFSIWHWLALLLFLLAVWPPIWIITRKAGKPAVLSILYFVPFVGLVFMYWLAFSRWDSAQD